MQAVTRPALERSRGEGRIDASVASDIARWLRGQTGAEDVRVSTFERLPGGAIQDNWTLDVEIDGGPWEGTHGFVLRTDALSGVSASLTRSQEFAVLRVAHSAGVIAPEPLFLCRDLDVIGRAFFVMRRIRGIAAGHRVVNRESQIVNPIGRRALVREQALISKRCALGKGGVVGEGFELLELIDAVFDGLPVGERAAQPALVDVRHAAALGFALTQPAFISLAVFLALGIGFAAPFVLIGISPALMRALPKPGAWMIRFKQALAFAMYGTAAWLVWVLAQQAGVMGTVSYLPNESVQDQVLGAMQKSKDFRQVREFVAMNGKKLYLFQRAKEDAKRSLDPPPFAPR